MLKERHFKDGWWAFSEYAEKPGAIAFKFFDSKEEEKSAIVGWKVIIDDIEFTGDTIEDFVEFVDKYQDDGKVILYGHELRRIYCFLKNYFETDKFDVGGKGIGLIDINGKFEIREVQMIASERWEEFSNQEKQLYKIYDVAKLIWSNPDIIIKHNVEGKIPLTLQQVVLNKMKSYMTKEDKELVRKLFPNTREGYLDTRHYMYIGGYCDKGNPDDIVDLKETIGHIDFKTSYIARMLCDYYPMTPFVRTDMTNLIQKLREKCCIIKARLYDVCCNRIKFLGKARLLKAEGAEYDEQGRLIKADMIEVMVNEIDLELIRMCYNPKESEVEELYIAERGQLPLYVRKTAEYFYRGKETKTGVERLWNKICTEIVYGATVKALYNTDKKDWKDVKDQAVLSPYWGYWTTSHARWALLTQIILLGEDFAYADTDSIFFKNPYLHTHLIQEYNKNQRARMFQYCIDEIIPYETFKNLGCWVIEDGATDTHYTIHRFKSPGPKRYMYSGECGLTVKLAGFKKQYKRNGKLVNAWEAMECSEDELFERFSDDYKVPDVIKITKEYDTPCTIIYNGREYNANGYLHTRYEVTHQSINDMFEEFARATELYKEICKDIGKNL